MKSLILFVTAHLILSGTGEHGLSISSRFQYTYMSQDTLAPPRLELEKTTIGKMQVLYIIDTAETTQAIGPVLGKGYDELMRFIQANKLIPIKFMAWYHAMQAPWPIEIAVETNGFPEKLAGRVRSKTIPPGDAVIVHMWGPYDQVSQAYARIEDWLKQNQRKAAGSPFEVYLNDPNAVKDPSEIRTDIYQPIQ